MTLDAVTHKAMLIQILKDIYTDETIDSSLGFKGGTAAYLFYELSRVSVDLDFDLLDPTQADHVFEQLEKILEPYGIIKKKQKKRYSLFFLLFYHNKLANAYNIKVEVNMRNFGSEYEIKPYLGISMKVMVQQDMCAHKMVAMVERLGKTNRDIFDVWFFLSNNWPINEKIIKLRTGLKIGPFLQKCIDSLESLSDKGILSGVGELLSVKQKGWAKEKLRSETIFLLKMRLGSVT